VETCHPLMPDCEHFDAVSTRRRSVEGDVSGAPLGDHEFAQSSPNWPADMWMTLEHLDGIDDHFRCRDSGGWFDDGKKLEQPIQIGQSPGTVGDCGQRGGRRALAPARAPHRRRAASGLSSGAGHDIRMHVLGGVERPASVDLGRRRFTFGNERTAHLGKGGLRLQCVDHPGVRRLACRFGQRRDPRLERLGQLEGRGRGDDGVHA